MTTPVVPLAAPASPSPAASASPFAVLLDALQPSTAPLAQHEHEQPASLVSAPAAARPSVHSRRLTLSRFPLLRKGSRELARLPASKPAAAPPPHPHALAAHPRASTSSVPPSPPRAPPVDGHEHQPAEAPPATTTPPVSQRPGKMHQTSSRLLRMTDDERPYTRDFKDLFSTLMVSLPLTPHRVRFRMIDFTFTSEEAVTNLGSLKFSQSNRMPDPKDSSRVVTTTTTTTFSMAKEMARSVCQKFLEAKFVESVEGKTDFTNKSSVWQLTPKGIHILERFCTRNGIQSAHVKAVLDSNRNPHQLVILERSSHTDKLHHDEQTVQIIFRRFLGSTANETQSDSDSIHEFAICNVGVKLVKNRKSASRPWEYSFNGRNAAQWLMDCSTMVDPREAVEIGSLFLQLKLIAPVDPRNSESNFQPVKHVVYYITEQGERAAGWTAEAVPMGGDVTPAKARDGMARDSNSNRTNVIIRNPSWRLLYREFLKETMCEENLSFYLEVKDFDRQYKAAVSDKGNNKVETIRETLAAAYGLYNAFLAPGSPNELNIDHALRTQLATRMTRAVGDDAAMLQSLNEVASLFEKAQTSIFKLMSSDSVPKFIKHPKYAPQLKGLDAAAAASYVAAPVTSRS
ncbi:regulator of G protein signaling domain-containing protein [Ampelomyces quisqualis]|uniref:Regulator of G protein signaling domain-containing protein n=1 Tax=Ampelomyces quisqualis TaxID=50730 RepID=A0A6A5R4S9_AMPQU|nr:regulator of G protein signaling domain-containing protein [Ampelomyces quisqualis]